MNGTYELRPLIISRSCHILVYELIYFDRHIKVITRLTIMFSIYIIIVTRQYVWIVFQSFSRSSLFWRRKKKQKKKRVYKEVQNCARLRTQPFFDYLYSSLGSENSRSSSSLHLKQATRKFWEIQKKIL